MERRPLGKTGLMLSPIGFGAFKIGRNQGVKYEHGYALPSDEEVEKLLNGVLDAGVNLIDTAPAYGTSEQRLGAAVGRRRAEFVLSTKVGETFEDGVSRYDFSAAAIAASVERSLKRLRTDFVDLLFIHSDGDDKKILEQTDAVAALQKLKASGAARFIGLSGKTVEGARAALAWADVVMVEYHMNDTSHAAVMKEAADRGVGVIVKKGLASGKLPAERAIPFVLQNPAVTSMVVGSLSAERMAANAALARRVDVGRNDE